MPDFMTYFSAIKDPRIERCKKHKLLDILFLTVSAVLSGAQGWEDIEEFAHAKIDWLKKFIELPSGVPTHDTIARVMGRLEPEALQRCFFQWMADVREAFEQDVIAIDGKSVRGSFDKASRKNALHMVNAWSCMGGVALGQLKVKDKSNEITAIPEILELLEIKKCIITIDAIGCQKPIAEKITEKKGDYVLSVKKNQPRLYDDLNTFFNEYVLKKEELPKKCAFYKHIDKAHGRIEIRKCWQSTDLRLLPATQDWKGVKSVLCMESTRHTGEESSTQVRYFISSLSLDPEKASQAVRHHWFVENKLHWVLDVTFGEDKSRIRRENAGENLTVLRRLALNICRRLASGDSNPKKLKKAAWDDHFRERLLFQEAT